MANKKSHATYTFKLQGLKKITEQTVKQTSISVRVALHSWAFRQKMLEEHCNEILATYTRTFLRAVVSEFGNKFWSEHANEGSEKKKIKRLNHTNFVFAHCALRRLSERILFISACSVCAERNLRMSSIFSCNSGTFSKVICIQKSS